MASERVNGIFFSAVGEIGLRFGTQLAAPAHFCASNFGWLAEIICDNELSKRLEDR